MSKIDWYHTIDLGGGVVTPGCFDHRPHLDQYPIPQRLDGLRALDVATFDGFWAFEFEKRGAAEVVAVDVATYADIDLPPAARARLSEEELRCRDLKEGFRLCREALRSKVRLEIVSVYDLTAEKVGTFDFVFCSDLLIHLTNPVRALQRIREVVSGYAVIVEPFQPIFPGTVVNYEGGKDNFLWWSFGIGCLEQMIRDAGFNRVELARKFNLRGRGGENIWRAAFRAYP